MLEGARMTPGGGCMYTVLIINGLIHSEWGRKILSLSHGWSGHAKIIEKHCLRCMGSFIRMGTPPPSRSAPYYSPPYDLNNSVANQGFFPPP